MLAGEELGQALARAMAMKGVGPSALARQFKVTPSSVGDWRKRGCIHKRHLGPLVAFFSDVVPPSHWGLEPVQGRASKPSTPPIVGTRIMSDGLYAVEGDKQRIEEKSEALRRQLLRLDINGFSPMALELAKEFDTIMDDQMQLRAFVKCIAVLTQAKN